MLEDQIEALRGGVLRLCPHCWL